MAAAATAGHVLDFDDTYLPGIAHLSAPTAPAALVLGAGTARRGGARRLHRRLRGDGRAGAASHPALYDRGLHPTAVCGGVGAAAAAARLMGSTRRHERSAVALALLGAGGLRAAFGSDGKALQVGWAAAAGVRAARLAAAGARAPLEAAARGVCRGHRRRATRSPASPSPRSSENWIKAWPCCLQTHGAIEAAASIGARPAPSRRPWSCTPSRCRRRGRPEPADGLRRSSRSPT